MSFVAARCGAENFRGFQASAAFNLNESITLSSRRATVSAGYRFTPKRYMGLGTGISWQQGSIPDSPEFPELEKGVKTGFDFTIFRRFGINFGFNAYAAHSLSGLGVFIGTRF